MKKDILKKSLFGIEGLLPPGKIFEDLSYDNLEKHILSNKEGKLANNGALMVDTGKYTGRSPNDKYFVNEESSKDNLWWGSVNHKISEKIFSELTY